jgi:hypothetical protein
VTSRHPPLVTLPSRLFFIQHRSDDDGMGVLTTATPTQTPRSLQHGGGDGGRSYGREAHAAATTIQAFVRAASARAEARKRRHANAVLAEFNARWAGAL